MKMLSIYMSGGYALDIKNPKISIDELKKKMLEVGIIELNTKSGEKFILRSENIESFIIHEVKKK